MSVHVFQKILTHDCKNIINDILRPTVDTIFLWEYIFDPKIKCSFVGELPILSWGKSISIDILVTTISHITPITICYTQSQDIIT
jgi:hypothetical protein